LANLLETYCPNMAISEKTFLKIWRQSDLFQLQFNLSIMSWRKREQVWSSGWHVMSRADGRCTCFMLLVLVNVPYYIVFKGERVWMSCFERANDGFKILRVLESWKDNCKTYRITLHERLNKRRWWVVLLWWCILKSETNRNLRREQGNGVWNLNELVEQMRSGWCSFRSATVSMCQELQPWWSMGCLPSKSVIILC
jgi:hypothetical protein